MRYEPEHKTQTRDRIVRNAARKLRAEGLSSPGVASVMKARPDSGRVTTLFGARRASPDAIAQAFSTARRSMPPCKTCRVRTDGRKCGGCTFHASTVISSRHRLPGRGLAPEIARAKFSIRKRYFPA